MTGDNWKYQTMFKLGDGREVIVDFNPPSPPENLDWTDYRFTINGKYAGKDSLFGPWNDDLIKEKVAEKIHMDGL